MNQHPDYGMLSGLPDEALVVSRASLESQIDDKANPLYTHRTLYRAAMAALSSEPLAGKHVLDYCSGSAEFGVWMASEGAEVTLLDPSPQAVRFGLQRAGASGLARRVKAVHLTDPDDLDMFAEDAFDLIFARDSGIACRKGAIEEIARILKPDARLLVTQPSLDGAVLNSLQPLFSEIQVQHTDMRWGLLARIRPSRGESLIVARK